MGSFQPTKTLLLLGATEPSSWSFHLSSMFVGMMFSGVVLAKWSLSSGDITLRAFNFQQVVDFVVSGCVEFLPCPYPTAHHTPHHSCLSAWVPPRKDCVSLSNTAIPSIASKVVESGSVTASTLPCTTACAFESNSVSAGRTFK